MDKITHAESDLLRIASEKGRPLKIKDSAETRPANTTDLFIDLQEKEAAEAIQYEQEERDYLPNYNI